MAKHKQEPVSRKHFDPFLKAKEELDKKIQDEGQVAVKAFLKEYFDKNQDVYGVKWTQYTPYFNDGEACVFSLYGVFSYATKELFDLGGDPYNEDHEGIVELYGKGSIQESLDEVLDILEVVFGDHAEVKANREKIEVEGYDHD